MEIKNEEKRIVLASNAMRNDRVSELLLSFACQLLILRQNAERSWIRRSRAAYQEAAEELCRLSRRVIWQLVKSLTCNAEQVRSAAEQFDEAADEIAPALASHPDVVTQFDSEIRKRASQLHAALDEFDCFQVRETTDGRDGQVGRDSSIGQKG